MNNVLTVITIAMLLFFAVSVGYFAHRIDKLDDRVTNIEMAKP